MAASSRNAGYRCLCAPISAFMREWVLSRASPRRTECRIWMARIRLRDGGCHRDTHGIWRCVSPLRASPHEQVRSPVEVPVALRYRNVDAHHIVLLGAVTSETKSEATKSSVSRRLTVRIMRIRPVFHSDGRLCQDHPVELGHSIFSLPRRDASDAFASQLIRSGYRKEIKWQCLAETL